MFDPDEFGSAPVAAVPVAPGAQGLITPVFCVFPVPIDMELAPDPLFPASDVESAMEVVVGAPGDCEAIAAVCSQAGDEVEVCANAAADIATPIAREAEKINRDMLSSKNSLPR